MNGEMGVNGVSEWGLWGAGGVSGAGGVLRRPRVRGERERECAKRVCKAGVRGVQGGVHTGMQGSSGADCTRVCKGGHHYTPIRTHTPCTTGTPCTLTLHQLGWAPTQMHAYLAPTPSQPCTLAPCTLGLHHRHLVHAHC